MSRMIIVTSFQQIYRYSSLYLASINNQMNLKIDQVLPNPPSLNEPYLFTFVPILQSLLLYPTPAVQEKPEQGNKKKFAFKGNSNAAPTVEPVYIFDLQKKIWRTQQTKGKFPSRREAPIIATLGPCLMVYGGKQVNPAKAMNDLYCLHLTSWQWKKLFVMEVPNPCLNSVAFAINNQNLALIGKDVWIFNAKGVNWELDKGDLPGGIWQKVDNSQLSLQIRCATQIDNSFIIFGWENGLKSLSFNCQTKQLSPLVIQNQPKCKGDNIQIMNTIEGKGLLTDKNCLHNFSYKGVISFKYSQIIEQISLDRVVEVIHKDCQTNFGFSSKKQLIEIEVNVKKQRDQQEVDYDSQQQLPNTARQIQVDYLKNSFIEKQSNKQAEYLKDSNIKREISEQSSSTPNYTSREDKTHHSLVKNLQPLLAAEWNRRRILQSKCKLLQNTIKRAQKMVILLCKYGGEQKKRAHIGKVLKIRQKLQESLNRQTYIRKQMQQRPGENKLREFVLKNSQNNFSQFLDIEDYL